MIISCFARSYFLLCVWKQFRFGWLYQAGLVCTNPDIKFYSGDAKTLLFLSPRQDTLSFDSPVSMWQRVSSAFPQTQQCRVHGGKTTRPRWLGGHTPPCFMWQLFLRRGQRVRLALETAASNSCSGSGVWLLPSRGLGGCSHSPDSRWPVTSGRSGVLVVLRLGFERPCSFSFHSPGSPSPRKSKHPAGKRPSSPSCSSHPRPGWEPGWSGPS